MISPPSRNSDTPFFSKVRINNIVSTTTLVLQDQTQGKILPYFYRSLQGSPLCTILFEISLKPVYPTMVGAKFLNSWCSNYWKMHFQVKRLRVQNPTPSFCINYQVEINYSPPPSGVFLKIFLSTERGEETLTSVVDIKSKILHQNIETYCILSS